MKIYIFLLTFSLCAVSVSAQTKKVEKTEPPQVEREPLQEIGEPIPSDGHGPIVAPYFSLTLNATKVNGERVRINDPNELENLDFSQLKEMFFSTMSSENSLDNKIIEKIFDEAVQLEVLEIRNFTLESFPEIKTPNHRLKKLSLGRNKLRSLPSSISNLIALEEFACINPLVELPESFSQLANLNSLGLVNVDFSEFPKSIFNLSKLSALYIAGVFNGDAKIKELPDLFHQLPELEEIGIKNTSLSALPPSFSALRKLEKADFSDNQFVKFPEVLATNPNLSYVPFASNPLKWEEFSASVKKIKWSGLFFLYGTGFTKEQYEEIQRDLPKMDVYYDEMND